MAQPLPLSSPEPTPRRRRSILRRVLWVLAVLFAVLAVAAVAGGVWFQSRLQASLPVLDGEWKLAGLSAPVSVERDGLGVPVLRAANRADAARALGFLHGQERFFQMDLLRRQAAGELAEIIGPAVVETDRQHRVHRFRDVAQRVFARAAPLEKALFEAYAAGVNAGLAALGEKPFEYLVLRADPAPWKPEDSILVIHAMFFELNDERGGWDSDLGYLHDTLPPALFAFLTSAGSEWDAPLVGPAFEVPPIPGPGVFDLRKRPAAATSTPTGAESCRGAPMWAPCPPGRPHRAAPTERGWGEAAIGSNNFAVAGTHTADGRAWVVNDPHLGIRVPNTWYRASLVLPGSRVTGMTLPGTPVVVLGSNGHVAWAFTNSYGDWTDLVVLETDPKDPEAYRTPEGPKRFETKTERIRVKGGEDSVLEVKETIWGPLIDQDHQGRPRALAWIAHRPEALNLGALGLESARTLEEAMAVANRSGIPPQNFVGGDDAGHIGWTIIGQMPRRVGFDGRLPTSWADGSRRWDGWLTPEEHPRVVDPPSGRIWTANSRVVDGEMLAKLGDGGYILGSRGRQIRDDLMALDKATPQDLLGVQLDDRALFLEHWRGLLLKTLSPEAVKGHPGRSELRRLVETTWTGRASIDSVAYRLVRSYRGFVMERVWDSLLGQADKPEDGRMRPPRQIEGPLWKILTERPAHLVVPPFQSWDEELLAVADDLVAYFEKEGGLAGRTWGERNTTRIQHPLSRALPMLSRWLDVPARPLPGDSDMPRFQSPVEGASARMVVSPGKEEGGIFHMPVGQSGHPLSPYYRKGHEAWEEGKPTPFLPGSAVHRLRLVP